MNQAPTLIINDELYLRQPHTKDIAVRFQYGRSPEFRKMVGGSITDIPPYTMKDAEDLYHREMRYRYSWFIIYHEKMIGVCRLLRQKEGGYRYSIGIYDDTLYSQGIGTKVTNRIIDFAFNELKLSQLELMVLSFNKRAIRSYEKAGFTYVKTLKNNFEVDGQLYDDVIMMISNKNRFELWEKDTLKTLTDKQKADWFDVYDDGLLEDRGYDPEILDLDNIITIHHKIEKEYYHYLESLANDRNFVCYGVLYKDSKIVSQARIIKKADAFYLEGLQTHRDHQRKGYARELMKHLVLSLYKHGVRDFYSQIRTHNTASINFHIRFGYSQIDKSSKNLYFHLDVMKFYQEQLFDEWASSYSLSVKESDQANTYPFAGYQKLHKTIVKRITSSISNGSILDMGIGTGDLSLLLSEAGYEITGVDISRRMVDIAGARIPRATMFHVSFEDSLSVLKGKTFDCIIFTYSIHHLPYERQIALLQNLYKLLGPDGFILIGDVMTNTEVQLKDLSIKYKDSWDSDEFYPVVDYYKAEEITNLFKLQYKQISHCSGVLILQK